MFWSLDLDDFNGSQCGKGTYPLLKAVNRALTGQIPEPITTESSTITTKPITCHSVPPYDKIPGIDDWCENVFAEVGNCPEPQCIYD